jgi:hypothetical protein
MEVIDTMTSNADHYIKIDTTIIYRLTAAFLQRNGDNFPDLYHSPAFDNQ